MSSTGLAPMCRTGEILPILALCGLSLAAIPATATAPHSQVAAEPASAVGVPESTGPLPAWQVTADVIQDAQGVVNGRIVALPGTASGYRGATVQFHRGETCVARTTADAGDASFAAPLPPGRYDVVVFAAGGTLRRPCRVWPVATAPPCARPILEIGAVEPVVRGQRPTMMSLSGLERGMAMGVIAAGAVATPIIYENNRSDHRVPLSP